jgi:amino acid transporter
MSQLHAVLALLVSGAIVMGYAVAGLFFLRFWRDTRDRLFLIFAVAFWIFGVQRLALTLSRDMVEDQTGLYLVRLFAFLLILAAIVDKNRTSSQPAG